MGDNTDAFGHSQIQKRATLIYYVHSTRHDISHHLTIASIPNRLGKTLVRTFAINGDRLALKTPETIGNGGAMVFELVWERLKSQ